MAGPEMVLGATGALGVDAIRRLQAVAITTVGDLRSALASTPEPIARLIGTEGLASLQALWEGDDNHRMHESMLAAVFEGPPTLGAEPPDDVEVLEEASEDLFATSLSGLGPLPEEAPAGNGNLGRVDCIDCLRPIRDQGNRGTCVAHAVAAVFECLLRRRVGHAIDLSPQFLYWSAKQHDGRPSGDGTLIRVATEQAVADGVCEEADWPYDPVPRPGDEAQGPPPGNSIATAGSHRATSVVPLTRKSSQAIRDSLDTGVPVAFSIPVYSVWANPTGKVPLPVPGAPRLGGHAMCAAGYTLDPSAPGGGWIIAKNSWGIARAPRSPVAPGYFSVPFDYVDLYGWETATLGVV